MPPRSNRMGRATLRRNRSEQKGVEHVASSPSRRPGRHRGGSSAASRFGAVAAATTSASGRCPRCPTPSSLLRERSRLWTLPASTRSPDSSPPAAAPAAKPGPARGRPRRRRRARRRPRRHRRGPGCTLARPRGREKRPPLRPAFQSGTVAPKDGPEGRYTVTLEHGLGQTIYFSDRPDRIVGAAPTRGSWRPRLPGGQPAQRRPGGGRRRARPTSRWWSFRPGLRRVDPHVTYEVEVLAAGRTSWGWVHRGAGRPGGAGADASRRPPLHRRLPRW